MVSENFRCNDCNAEVRWLTPEAVSAITGMSVPAVRRWAKNGRVHSWRLPNDRLLICSRSLKESEHRRRTEMKALLPANVRDGRIRRAVEYLKANPTEKVTVEQLAKVAGLSISRFEELFKKEVGMGLKQYQRKVRVRQAEPLLADGNLNITQVAEKLGYPESSHFSRDYKKETGQTPSNHRKKLLGRR